MNTEGILQATLLLLPSHFSRVRLCATPETAAHQAPLSLGFSRQNTGVGCHFLLQCVKVKVKSLSHVQPSATPWTAAYQAPPSMRFSRQEYWNGLPLPSALLIKVSYNRLYFCIVCCNLSFFSSNFVDLILLSFFLDESG